MAKGQDFRSAEGGWAGPSAGQATGPMAWIAAWQAMSTGAMVAVGLCVLVLLALLWWLLPLAMDAVRPVPKPLAKATPPTDVLNRQAATFEGYLKQVKGRSLFFVPAAPKPPEPPPAPVGDKPPPAPTTYGGPSIVAMLSDIVWFSDGKKIKIGEKAGDLEVIALSPPWVGRIKWSGVEFDVNLFKRNELGKDKKPTEETKSEPSKPAEEPKTSDKPADAAKPGEKGTTSPGDKVGDKPGEKAADKGSDKPGTKPGDAPGDKASDKPGDKASDKPADKPVTKPGDKPGDKPPEKPPEKPGSNLPPPSSPPSPPPTPSTTPNTLG